MSFPSEPQRGGGGVRLGAVQGLSIWIGYGVVEAFFLTILPWLSEPSYLFLPPPWGFAAVGFGLYAVTGVLVGAACGRILSAEPVWRLRAAVLFSLVLAWSVNGLLRYPRWRLEFVFCVLPLWMILGLVATPGLRPMRWAERLKFTANPWTVSAILLGGAWVHNELAQRSRIAQAGGILLSSILILTLSWLARKTLAGVRPPAALVAGALTLAVTFFLEPTPKFTPELPAKTPSPHAPDILLITLDTVRADHMGLYGYERRNTPSLEKLVKEATVYAHAIAPGDMTLSTHASLFTGLYASRHGAHYFHDNRANPAMALVAGDWRAPALEPGFRTLAESLSAQGYFTAAVVANYGFLGHQFGIDQGFQNYDAREAGPFVEGGPSYCLRDAFAALVSRFIPPASLEVRYRNAEQINQEAFALLDKTRRQNRKFFLFLNYMDAHWPYMPPAPFDTLYPGKDVAFLTPQFNGLRTDVVSGKRLPTEAEYAHMVSQYDGGIAYLDSELGKLIEWLKDRGLYDNLMIIVTSDHGEAFGEHGLLEHGVSVYQDQVWVPLIVKYPGRNAPETVLETVSLVDVMPTVLDSIGGRPPEGLDGVSLRRVGGTALKRVYAESFPFSEYFDLYPRFRRVERAAYQGNRKLISSTAGKREFYDLSKDPREIENILPAQQAEALEMESHLTVWLKSARKVPARPSVLDNKTLERLRSLGYVQ